MMNEDVIRPAEAASLLHCSAWTIGDLVRKGVLPHFRIGNRILFRTSTLLAWIEAQEKTSVACNSEENRHADVFPFPSRNR